MLESCKKLALLLTLASLGIGCDSKTIKPVLTLEVAPENVEVFAYETFEITATFESSYVGKHYLTFSSQDTDVVQGFVTTGQSVEHAEVDDKGGQFVLYPDQSSQSSQELITGEVGVRAECVDPGETDVKVTLRALPHDNDTEESNEYAYGQVHVTCKPLSDGECDESHALYGQAVVTAQLLQIGIAAFCGTLTPLQILFIIHSSDSVGQKSVAHDHTTYIAVWAAAQFYTLVMLNTMFNMSDFDCGQGPNGYTICPSTVNDLAEGDYLVFAAIVEEDIPLNDPDNIYQYAFVLDSDGDTGNNYQPIPAYPNDFFSDTDLWYVADYSAVNGWTLTASDATDSVITEVATDARIIISGNSLFLVVPASEIAVSNPQFRITAFRHTGDYGMNEPHDWDGSIWPAVADGLTGFPTTGE